MKTLTIIISFFLYTYATAQVKVGQKELPKISVEDLSGKKSSIDKYITPGKNYVITFWATWCVPCKREITNMLDLVDNWKTNLNTEVIAIATDDSRAKNKIKTYVKAENWPITVLLDQNQDLMRSLGIQSIPYTLIINEEGKIVYTHSSYSEGDEFEIENILTGLKK